MILVAAALLAGCATSGPRLVDPPPEPAARKKAALTVSGGSADKSEKELAFHKTFADKCLALIRQSDYFSEVSLESGDREGPITRVLIHYDARLLQPDPNRRSEAGFWGDFLDFETQAMCCLSGGIIPMHRTHVLAVHLTVEDEAGRENRVSRERVWGTWTWQPYLVPVYADFANRLQGALLELVVEAVQEARRTKLI